MPLGTEKAKLLGAAGGADGNYFGDGTDGALSTSGNVTYTTLNKNGSYDADMVVKNYTSVTIAAGHTVTVDQPCRGLLMYCNGDVSISGTLSMTGKGGNSDPTLTGGSDSAAVNANGIQLGMFTASGTDTLAANTFAGSGNAAVAAVANQPAIAGDGTKYTISRIGGSGGSGGGPGSCSNCGFSGSTGTAGQSAGTTLSTGGGGGGGFWSTGSNKYAGAGGKGGCFSGGPGGGGSFQRYGYGAHNWGGGAGGEGSSQNSNQGGAHGGAGNPGGGGVGSGPSYGGTGGQPGQDGVGGIIWLIVKGNVTVNSGGTISCNGKNGGSGSSHRTPGGGGSGGGVIFILYTGTYTNNGTVQCAGGTANTYGGSGGTGGIYASQVSE